MSIEAVPMDDEIDIVPRAVGEVIWTYFHILNSWAARAGEVIA
jgi:hypothetical protein